MMTLARNYTKPIIALLIIAAFMLPSQAAAEERYRSQYAAEKQRQIKSLSDQDIDALVNGRGWGLAKAAELNGLPGPLHVLEMRDEIALTAEQASAIEALFQSMKSKAATLGRELVEFERQLNQGFAEKTISSQSLRTSLQRIAETRMALRFVHLNAHLATPEILSPEQVVKYNELRGYGSSDPCTSVPQGHNPTKWKRHNGCD